VVEVVEIGNKPNHSRVPTRKLSWKLLNLTFERVAQIEQSCAKVVDLIVEPSKTRVAEMRRKLAAS